MDNEYRDGIFTPFPCLGLSWLMAWEKLNTKKNNKLGSVGNFFKDTRIEAQLLIDVCFIFCDCLDVFFNFRQEHVFGVQAWIVLCMVKTNPNSSCFNVVSGRNNLSLLIEYMNSHSGRKTFETSYLPNPFNMHTPSCTVPVMLKFLCFLKDAFWRMDWRGLASEKSADLGGRWGPLGSRGGVTMFFSRILLRMGFWTCWSLGGLKEKPGASWCFRDRMSWVCPWANSVVYYWVFKDKRRTPHVRVFGVFKWFCFRQKKNQR